MQKVELPLFGETLSFSLENFEGPLELLLYLIQKEEIDLFDVPLKELTSQFFKELEEIKNVDIGADFLWNSSRLLLLKSRRLLPQEETPATTDPDLRLEILQKLIEYTRLKEVASALLRYEEQQMVHFSRTPVVLQRKLGTGLEEVKVEELKRLLQDLILKAEAHPKKKVVGEEWEIGPKIAWLKENVKLRLKIPFEEVFSLEKTKGELIVFFLAMLECMKGQLILIVLENSNYWICDAESI